MGLPLLLSFLFSATLQKKGYLGTKPCCLAQSPETSITPHTLSVVPCILYHPGKLASRNRLRRVARLERRALRMRLNHGLSGQLPGFGHRVTSDKNTGRTSLQRERMRPAGELLPFGTRRRVQHPHGKTTVQRRYVLDRFMLGNKQVRDVHYGTVPRTGPES